ncbi:hypothetical protein [Litchfieldella xinjiangensis]|uniref:hypothetical protein n=1 Tax=Litchfieldella xinjiangensis TaxID=1166948 RepID=UPI0005BD39D8|nr:hypothetical protein [Halomonas xinjiangensis]
MADIDKHSTTWRAVTEWAQAERAKAVSSLIAGSGYDDKLRGDIRTLDSLMALTDEPPPAIPAAEYD